MDKMSSLRKWAPRILSMIFVLFLMLFSLDVFESGASIGEIAIGLFVHNIPAFILAIVVAISWKYEIVGGVVFILAGIVYIVLVTMPGSSNGNRWIPALIIALPALVTGVLFITSWVKKKKN